MCIDTNIIRLKMVEMIDLDPVVRDAAENIIHNTQQMLSEPVDTKPMDDDNEREVNMLIRSLNEAQNGRVSVLSCCFKYRVTSCTY